MIKKIPIINNEWIFTIWTLYTKHNSNNCYALRGLGPKCCTVVSENCGQVEAEPTIEMIKIIQWHWTRSWNYCNIYGNVNIQTFSTPWEASVTQNDVSYK